MKRLVVALSVVFAAAAFADKASVDAYLVKSCNAAKESVGKHAGVCDEEIKALAAVDCGDAKSRKTVMFNTLETACSKKAREEHNKATGAKTVVESVPCKAVDEAGTVLGETTAEAIYKCNAALKPMVETHCPSKPSVTAMKFTILSTIQGKESKAPGVFMCPAKK